MSNVRPGQLAIVVNREVLPENNGKIVKVIEEIRSGNPFPGPGGGIFWGSLDRGPFWIVESMGTPKPQPSTLLNRTDCRGYQAHPYAEMAIYCYPIIYR